MPITLDFENTTNHLVPNGAQFETWIQAALSAPYQNAELSICIIDEVEMTELNHQFRDKNKSTNVLSFPADIPPEVEINLLGDIAICAEVIEREATAQGKDTEAHYAHMAIHGALHLAGYDHIEDDEARKMEALETKLLNALGFPDPYKDECI